MTDSTFTQMESWSRTVNSMLWGHWLLLDAGFRATQTVLAAAVPITEAAPASGHAGLITQALERIKKGLAPPREIYLAPYRNQIDWSALPDWARPGDPDLFEGCGHEG